MTMTLRRTFLAAGALSLVLPLSACFSSNDDEISDDDNTSKTLKPTAWEKASAASVESGRTLKLAIPQFPKNFNDQASVDDQVDLPALDPTRGNAVRIRADGTWTVDKNYAESVELVDKDPQEVEVKLNKNAVWSDGKPIVAKDMIAWWKARRGSDENYDVPGSVGFEDISSIKQGKDQFTYTVRFASPHADWPLYVYPKLPSSVTSTAKAFNKGFVKKAVPGNGPFVISKIDPVAGTITETRNRRWWGDKPKLDRIVFRAIDPRRQAQAFVGKKIDAVEIGQDKAAYDIAAQRKGVDIQRSGGLDWTHLTFNAARGPLKDVKVRRAIAHALNRKALSGDVNKPVGAPAVTQDSMIYLPGQKGYQDNASAAIGFDLEKSEALLKQAGYTKGSNGLHAKGGKPLALSITVPSGVPSNAQRAQLIQGQLKKVGITVKLDTVPMEGYFDDHVIPLNFDMVTFSWQGNAFPVSTTQSLFNPIDSGQNFTGITSPALGGLWDKANAELDPAKQIALAQDIDKELYTYVPLVTIAPAPMILGVAEGLVNYGSAQFEHPDYTKVGYKK